MSKNAQHNQDSTAAANGAIASSEGKSKTFKLLGWRYFGLFKPCFKLGSRHKNREYEKGYN